jgi:cell division initiation protein
MKVTPLDLRQQRFRTSMRGFDKTEVVAFLTEAADDYEQALREKDRLQEELARLEGLLTEHREHERNLRNTLLTAQRLADEIKAAADQEAKRVVREAEGRAELILQKAQARAEEVQREIDGMKMKRRDVLNSLDATMGALRNATEYVREQEQRERDDRILLHRPQQADAVSAPRPGETRRLDDDAPPKVEGR